MLLLRIKTLQAKAKATTKKKKKSVFFCKLDMIIFIGFIRLSMAHEGCSYNITNSSCLVSMYFNANPVTSLLLQVVGGKMTESGRLCAFITKVRKGSLADTVGHLRPGINIVIFV